MWGPKHSLIDSKGVQLQKHNVIEVKVSSNVQDTKILIWEYTK